MNNDFEKRLSSIAESIISSYTGEKTIDEVKAYDHPDKDSVIDIVTKLKKIIFAGYFRNSSYRAYTLRNSVTMLLEDVVYNLTIAKSDIPHFVKNVHIAGFRKHEHATMRLYRRDQVFVLSRYIKDFYMLQINVCIISKILKP